MPCKCAGYRLEKCKCQLVRSRFPLNPAGGQFVYLSQNDCTHFKPRRSAKTSNVLRLLERLYEKCAGFNLRHCPFRRFPGSNNYFIEVLMELFLLVCFLVANLVVFTAIFTRMALTMSLVAINAVKWLNRSICSKTAHDTRTSSGLNHEDRQDLYHNFAMSDLDDEDSLDRHYNFTPPCYRF